MRIDNSPGNWPTTPSSTTVGSASPGSSSFAQALARSTANLSDEAKQNVAAIMRKYDFTQITPQQLRDAMSELGRAGHLDLDASGSLLIWAMRDSPMTKVDYDGLPGEGSDRPMNVMEGLQRSINFALSMGNLPSAAASQRTLDLLNGFQAHRRYA